MIEIKEEHPQNTPFPKLFTDGGIVTEIKAEHPQNAISSRVVTDGGSVTEVKEEHPPKMAYPIEVTVGVL